MSPSVHISWPSSSIFKFPPDNEPHALPPASPGSSLSAPPFAISPSLYNAVLDVKVPITIACVYAASVVSLNAYNRSRGNKPWPISQTKAFFWFVVAHNILLAVYSGWTFVGMWDALRESVVSPFSASGLAGTVDSLCKIQGPRGLGSAIAYNATTSSWVSQSPSTVFLTAAALPAPTDQGRIWNQGLAFYGWFFYLSKFYEVLDTVIILAKGKRSSTLQTYHHAGAMMSMWSGMRYMSPPIWMFVFVNSGIHALMYTYYTLTAFSVPIPQSLKRSLTTMQIIQFLVGASYAAIHSFVSYDIPVQVPFVKRAFESATSVASSVVSSATEVAMDATFVDLLKKLIFRALGEEGLAGNVDAKATSAVPPVPTKSSDGISYTTEYQTVPCIDTSGQTFAIWFNVFYLTPLTFLFVRFFIKSYFRRGTKGVKKAVAAIQDGTALKDHTTNGHVSNGHASNGHAATNGTPNGKSKSNGTPNGTPKGTPNGKSKSNGHANGKAKH